MPWLVGRFEFLGEKALGAALTVLTMPDEREAFRAQPAAAPRTAVARDLWQQLAIDELADNEDATAALRRAASAARPAAFGLGDIFAGQAEAAGLRTVIAAPVAFNREVLGVGILLVEASPLVEQMALMLAEHTAVAIAQMRVRDEARRFHSVDQRLWVPDEHFMLTQFRREVLRARRYGREVGLALLRLENEGDIRSRFGDFFTDHLLRRIGSQLAAEVRDSDILGALRGAYAIIHTETPLAGTHLSANRLRDTVTSMVRQRFPESPEPEFSVNVASFPETADTAEEIVRRVTTHPAQDAAA
jgi:diguanylate cyclase (GGDEF)-like protein